MAKLIEQLATGASLHREHFSELYSDRELRVNQGLAEIHSHYGLDFPIDETGDFSNPARLALARDRFNTLSQIRSDSADMLNQLYGTESEQAAAAELAALIGPYLDQIAISQLEKHDKVYDSWSLYNDQAAKGLTSIIDQLISGRDKSYSHVHNYLEKNSETKSMLRIISSLSGHSHTPEALKESVELLERLAIVQYQKGVPVVLFCMTDELLDPHRFHDHHPRVIMPDCRLILPFESDDTKAMTREIIDEANSQFSAYPTKSVINQGEHVGVFGIAVSWAGAQLLSYTTGEAFNGTGYVFAVNLIKTRTVLDRIYTHLGIPVSEDAIRYAIELYIYHELGHKYFRSPDKYLVEFAIDAAVVAQYLSKYVTYDDVTRLHAIISLLAEYQRDARHPLGKNPIDDGYTISGRIILDRLWLYNIIRVLSDDETYDICPDQINIQRFIHDIRALHVHAMQKKDQTTAALGRTVKLPRDIKHWLAMVK